MNIHIAPYKYAATFAADICFSLKNDELYINTNALRSLYLSGLSL